MSKRLRLRPFDATAGDPHTFAFLTELVTMSRATCVVEAGTYAGHFALSAAARGATVYTADPIEFEYWPELIATNALEDRVHFVQADFAEIAVRFPHIVGAVDLAFVDSGPPFLTDWEDQVRVRHYELAKQWVRPGGLVVVDDVNATDWQGSVQIRAEACLLLPGGRGLSLWRKPA